MRHTFGRRGSVNGYGLCLYSLRNPHQDGVTPMSDPPASTATSSASGHQETRKDGKRGEWAKAAERIVAFIAGIATIIATGLAFLTISQSSTITNNTQTINEIQQTNNSLQAAYDSATSANAIQRSQNSQLSAQLAAATAATTVTVTATAQGSSAVQTPSGPGAVGTVYHQGPLSLLSSSPSANLDAPASDPGWGIQVNQSRRDFLFTGNNFSGGGQGSIMGISTGDGSYDSCRSEAMGSLPINRSDLQVGSIICLTTDELRIASLKISALTDTKAVLDVTVYNKAS